MKTYLAIGLLFFALQGDSCESTGIRQEDARKNSRPSPSPGAQVMTTADNRVGVLHQPNDGSFQIIYPDGSKRDAAEIEIVPLPAAESDESVKLPKRPGVNQ